jgi:hypothetical protein
MGPTAHRSYKKCVSNFTQKKKKPERIHQFGDVDGRIFIKVYIREIRAHAHFIHLAHYYGSVNSVMNLCITKKWEFHY